MRSPRGRPSTDRRTSSVRRARLALLGVLASIGVVLPARAADCAESARLTDRADGWTTVTPPPFAAGPSDVRLFGTAPTDENLLVVSNGTTVQRSADGGCTWSSPTLPVAGTPVSSVALDTITFTPRPELPDAVLVLGHERLSGAEQVVRPRVWVSLDTGKTFTPAEVGLPPVGHALRLAGLQAPESAVLGIEDGTGQGGGVQFYTTRNSGTAWAPAPRTSVAANNSTPRGPALRSFEVNPRDPAKVWAWDGTKLYYSENGGGVFAPVRAVTLPVTALDITPSPDIPGRVRVRAFHEGAGSEYSDNDGQTWTSETEPGRLIREVASIPFIAGLYGTASDEGVFVRQARGGRLRLTPRDIAPRVDRLSFTAAANPYLYAGNGRQLLRRRLFSPESAVTLLHESVGVLQAAPPTRLRAPALTPGYRTLRVPPGGHVDVAYDLDLPPIPTPLDIYFLTDTTPSMQPVINGLRLELAGVINDLAALGISSRFGLADFREYPEWGAAGDNYPYRRLRPVSEVDGRLRTALDSLATGGGVVGNYTSGLEALYQSATGAGRLARIPAGLGPQFRADAVKVIVMATESQWREATLGYPGPNRDETFAALKQAGIHVVGLATGQDIDRAKSGGNAGGPGPPLRDVARATDTYAPEEGIDCNEDQVIDVGPGEPLVCPLTGTPRLGPAMRALLAAVIDVAEVRFDVVGSGVTARAITPAVFPTVDVKRAHHLPLTVRYSCAAQDVGKRGAATVSVRSGDTTLDQARVDVLCATAPATRVVPPVQEAVPLAAVVVVPPAPPAAQLPIAQPPPNVNPNANPNPNPNVGVVAERQQQLQLAVATEDLRPDTEQQMAFSALPERQHLPWEPVLVLSGLLFATACACCLRLSIGHARATEPHPGD